MCNACYNLNHICSYAVHDKFFFLLQFWGVSPRAFIFIGTFSMALNLIILFFSDTKTYILHNFVLCLILENVFFILWLCVLIFFFFFVLEILIGKVKYVYVTLKMKSTIYYALHGFEVRAYIVIISDKNLLYFWIDIERIFAEHNLNRRD